MSSKTLGMLALVALGVFPASAVEVLFVGGGASPSLAADAAALAYLEGRYGASEVDYASGSSLASGDESAYDVVVISSTIASADVRGKFNGSPVPVVCWERVVVANGSGDFAVTSAENQTATNHRVRISTNHPITEGFSVGQLVPICSGSAEVFWAVAPDASGKVRVLEDDDDSTRGFITVVDQGGILMNGGAAPARRVVVGLKNDTFSSLTADGRRLFGQAVDWAAAGSLSVAAPVVGNAPASSVAASSATIGGTVTDDGGLDPQVTLYWGNNDGGSSAESWDHAINLGTQGGSFSAELSGLSPSTTYYFRSFARNAGGDGWAGATSSFTTAPPPNPPVVANQAASELTFSSAELNGAVSATGGEEPLVTIFYGLSDGGTLSGSWDESVALGGQSGTFSTSLFDLTHGTTYYFRAFAQNSGGSAWAATSGRFSTLAAQLPAVTSSAAESVGGSSARISGVVTGTGGDVPTVTLYWGDEDGGTTVGSWDQRLVLGAFASDFSQVLSGLNPETRYFFRMAAENIAGVAWSTPTRSFTTLEVSPLVLNEFMASNDGGASNNPNGWWPIANQVPGAKEDWVEIANKGTGTMNLAGWHLSDDAGNLTKWTFPSPTWLGPGEFLVVYASDEAEPDIRGNLHTNFKLSADGEFLALTRPNLSIASSFGPAGADFPAQSDDVSYGVHPLSGAAVYFNAPTPGAANDANGLAQVADTKFFPDRGFYSSAVSVTISTATPGATIYYTTDGSAPIDGDGDPTGSAMVYGGPVMIAETTAVRAAAVLSGFAPTDIDTQSYILLDIRGAAVDGSDPGGLNGALLDQVKPGGWDDLSSGDYEMDPTVSRSTASSTGHGGLSGSQALLQGMRDLPTISIAMDRDDFSGSDDGIYTHPQSRNSGSFPFAWERACSTEFIPAEGDPRGDWGVNCGLRIQGGASRNPASSPKHSMSLRFRGEYGVGRLNEKLFPDGPVNSFNVLSLRAGYNNSWIHSAENQRGYASMIRDQWARDTMLEMGNADGGRGMMVHLYVNGLYWGVHNLCERADASHYAEYNGGDRDQLDALNGGAPTDGDTSAWETMKSVVTTGSWSEIQEVLDVDNYIDYQIFNRFAGNGDLKTNGNWRAAGGGPFPAGQPGQMAPWRLFSWDAEQILTSPSSAVVPRDPLGEASSGAVVRDVLESIPEYRLRFADRLQKHLFHGGALTQEACSARWMARAAELDRAILAESARWGDHRRTPAYTRNVEWLAEQSRLIGSYFPVRGANVMNGYLSEGLLPSLDAPAFLVNGVAQHGGEIPTDGTLTVTSPSGMIYYTLDGSDPRFEGGGINPAATGVASGQSISLPSSLPVRARVLSGGEWSALSESVFYVESLAAADDLVISEIHYHPYDATASELAAGLALEGPRDLSDSGLFEFVELRNQSANAVNLSGVRFSEGVAFTFGNRVLNAGDFVVVAKDAEAFAIRYPLVPLAGVYAGSLANEGETVTLLLESGERVQSTTYGSSGQWPGRADGEGSSLELVGSAEDSSGSESWRSSSEFNGSPGADGAGPDLRVVINEVLSHSELPTLDAVELFNTTASPIDVGGWVLSDRPSVYRSFRIPDGTMIAGGGYLVFDEADFNAAESNRIENYAGTLAASPTEVSSPDHGLGTGDIVTISGYGGYGDYGETYEVTVLDENSFSIETPFLDNHGSKGTWTPGRPFALSSAHGEELSLLESTEDGQLLRFVDQVDFAAAFPGESLGRWPNGAGYGTLVSMTSGTFGRANEGPQVGPVVISELMYHREGAAGDLLEFVEILNAGVLLENLDHWRLRGGADFDFTAAQQLAPGETLVLVAFDPEADPSAAESFRSEYGIGTEVRLVGPFTDGPLDDVAGTVRLQRPDLPPSDEPDHHPQVTEDEVRYSALAPWPVLAGGAGDSLQRIDLDGFGNFSTSWTAATPEPGRWAIDFLTWRESFFGANLPTGSGPEEDFDNDGVDNLIEFALGMNPLADDREDLPSWSRDGSEFVFAYTKSTATKGLTSTVKTSIDLMDWQPVTDSYVSSEGFFETREVRIPIAGPKRFVGLVVEEDF
ncbi:lamin tail domain-containing protein [Haloferula chungangensis]|uniref:Lamin tail domain-containing protein n=1 Tax=Haloferula chungangensis TaxID=1048331 RepID=A0ABW2L608_9BACT